MEGAVRPRCAQLGLAVPPSPRANQAPAQALRESSVYAETRVTKEMPCLQGRGSGLLSALVDLGRRALLPASGQAPPGLQLLGQSFRDELPRRALET